MKLKEKNKQNFQGEITSGFIVKLEKLTQENIELGRQQQQQKQREKHDKKNRIKRTYNLFSN